MPDYVALKMWETLINMCHAHNRKTYFKGITELQILEEFR